MRVGTCGWGYLNAKQYFGEGWRERFVSKLQAYAQLFDCVEVNSTFYRLPRLATAEKWRKEVPDNFVFTVKAYRGITHDKRFEGVERETEQLLAIARALRAPIILIQTPKSFRDTEENVQRVQDYLSTLPNDFTYALELRGWGRESIAKILDKRTIHVVDPFAERPLEQDVYYFRLHGSPPGDRMYYYQYRDEDLRWLADYVRTLEAREIWIFFNNIWMYDDALRFKRLIA